MKHPCLFLLQRSARSIFSLSLLVMAILMSSTTTGHTSCQQDCSKVLVSTPNKPRVYTQVVKATPKPVGITLEKICTEYDGNIDCRENDERNAFYVKITSIDKE